jgi:ABC-type polysaccharide/polyol phosphate transport system ATPase subunit
VRGPVLTAPPRAPCKRSHESRHDRRARIRDDALGDRLILDQASFALPERARVGIVGRNGAGKTTLFRIATGWQGADR